MIEHETCKCEPCPFDIRTLGYPTCKEDAAFEGTQCKWHEQIRGSVKRVDRQWFVAGGADKASRKDFVKASAIFVCGGTPEDPMFSLDNEGIPIVFGLKELPFYAKKIGAKRK